MLLPSGHISRSSLRYDGFEHRIFQEPQMVRYIGIYSFVHPFIQRLLFILVMFSRFTEV